MPGADPRSSEPVRPVACRNGAAVPKRWYRSLVRPLHPALKAKTSAVLVLPAAGDLTGETSPVTRWMAGGRASGPVLDPVRPVRNSSASRVPRRSAGRGEPVPVSSVDPVIGRCSRIRFSRETGRSGESRLKRWRCPRREPCSESAHHDRIRPIMTMRRRKMLRTSLSGILFLGLLGLSTFDVALCHGADGHVGFKTSGMSCCPNALSSATSSPESAGASSLHPGAAGEQGQCRDIPLLQEIRPSHEDGGTASTPGSLTSFALPTVASVAAPPAASAPGPHPILIHLRSTNLLI